MRKPILIFVVLFSLFSTISCQTSNYFNDIYNKAEYRIKMRDGVTLFTAVYSPKDTTEKHAILLCRTPYSVAPYGEAYRNIPSRFIEENYIVVFQDVRGKFMSEGKYVNMREYIPEKTGNETDETTDTYDTIDWLVKNIRNNNGNVGMWGISYPGFYASMGTIDSHPALKAVLPQAPIADWFIGDDMHHNGALSLLLSFNFFSVFDITVDTLYKNWFPGLGLKTPDAYTFFRNMGPLSNANKYYLHGTKPFWNDLMEFDTYSDYWKRKNILPHLKNTKPAVMVVGGWYDGEDLYGALNTYRALEQQNKDNFNIIVMGPWTHGEWDRGDGRSLGDIGFDSETSKFYREKLEMPFFNYFLKGKGDYVPADAMMFETGSNKWKKYSSWPPKNTFLQTFYLNSNETLTKTKPESDSGFDEYISNPDKPVPYTAKQQDAASFYYKPYLNEDQRFAASRPDVLVYETEPLDKDIVVAGKTEITLEFTCSTTDVDFVVKLIDVYPDSAKKVNNVEFGGYQELIRGDIFRAKFRNSFSKPIAITPQKVEKLQFNLQDINHCFKKGHKMMVQIQSSWFPLFDRNPQEYIKITEYQGNFRNSAKINVLRNRINSSFVKLPILNN